MKTNCESLDHDGREPVATDKGHELLAPVFVKTFVWRPKGLMELFLSSDKMRPKQVLVRKNSPHVVHYSSLTISFALHKWV